MLYSSKYNFVYSKSFKTASTSTEAALEYLIRNKFPPHETNSVFYEDGSRIGFRGFDLRKDPNLNTRFFSRNHQSLYETREMIGITIFNKAFKISSIRNPYDRAISAFHHFGKQNIHELIGFKNKGSFIEIKKAFTSYLKNHDSAQYDGREHFFINSKMMIDKFVRMESISKDLKEILNHLKVPREVQGIISSNIPEHKKNTTRIGSNLTISDYFTEETIEFINKKFSNWFTLGGYKICQSETELNQHFKK